MNTDKTIKKNSNLPIFNIIGLFLWLSIALVIGLNAGKLIGIGLWKLINWLNILDLLEKISDFITFV